MITEHFEFTQLNFYKNVDKLLWNNLKKVLWFTYLLCSCDKKVDYAFFFMSRLSSWLRWLKVGGIKIIYLKVGYIHAIFDKCDIVVVVCIVICRIAGAIIHIWVIVALGEEK